MNLLGLFVAAIGAAAASHGGRVSGAEGGAVDPRAANSMYSQRQILLFIQDYCHERSPTTGSVKLCLDWISIYEKFPKHDVQEIDGAIFAHALREHMHIPRYIVPLLSDEQIGMLPRDTYGALFKRYTPIVMASLDRSQVAALTDEMWTFVRPDVFAALKREHIEAIRPEAMVQWSQHQVDLIPPKTAEHMSKEQRAVLLAHGVRLREGPAIPLGGYVWIGAAGALLVGGAVALYFWLRRPGASSGKASPSRSEI